MDFFNKLVNLFAPEQAPASGESSIADIKAQLEAIRTETDAIMAQLAALNASRHATSATPPVTATASATASDTTSVTTESSTASATTSVTTESATTSVTTESATTSVTTESATATATNSWAGIVANNPDQSAKPTKPVQPAKSVQPTKPVQPAKSVQPAKPVQPAKSVQPANPTRLNLYTLKSIPADHKLLYYYGFHFVNHDNLEILKGMKDLPKEFTLEKVTSLLERKKNNPALLSLSEVLKQQEKYKAVPLTNILVMEVRTSYDPKKPTFLQPEQGDELEAYVVGGNIDLSYNSRFQREGGDLCKLVLRVLRNTGY
jgi:hypothetical protein